MAFPYSENKITLYTSVICPFAHRVVWSLHEAGIDYHTENIDLSNKPEWYPAVNPATKVPAMRLPQGDILVESLLISEYLAEKYPETGILPKDELERFKVRLFIDYFGNNILAKPYQLLAAKTPEDRQNKVEEIKGKLLELNTHLQNSSKEGPYFMGDRFTLAEIATIPFIERLDMAGKMLGVSFENIPGLERYYAWRDAAESRPAYKSTVATYDQLAQAYTKYLAK